MSAIFKIIYQCAEIALKGVAKMFGVETLKGGAFGEGWILLLGLLVLVAIIWAVTAMKNQ
jgi:hypothetical protein